MVEINSIGRGVEVYGFLLTMDAAMDAEITFLLTTTSCPHKVNKFLVVQLFRTFF